MYNLYNVYTLRFANDFLCYFCYRLLIEMRIIKQLVVKIRYSYLKQKISTVKKKYLSKIFSYLNCASKLSIRTNLNIKRNKLFNIQ